MYKLTSTLIAGSPVSPGSHPILLSLLELAAQPPGIDRNGFPDATSWESFRKRVQRDWGEVAAAFKAAVLAGVTDEALIALCPHEGLSFSAERGWELKPFEHDSYRKRVASLIKKAAFTGALADRMSDAEMGVVVNAFVKAIRAELALKKALKDVGYVVYAAGVDGHVKALRKTMADIQSDNT